MRSDSDPAARTVKMVSDGRIQVHTALRECVGYNIKTFHLQFSIRAFAGNSVANRI